MNIGDKIPENLGLNIEGKEVRESDFAGKPLIIYFYPKDNKELKDLGYEVIGISKDSIASHVKFADKYTLPFLLLSDPTTEVNQAFGVWQKKKMAGREYMGTVRTTFVTDADHNITHIINKVDTKNAGEQLIKLIKA